jgi:hypothetical protein
MKGAAKMGGRKSSLDVVVKCRSRVEAPKARGLCERATRLDVYLESLGDGMHFNGPMLSGANGVRFGGVNYLLVVKD